MTAEEFITEFMQDECYPGEVFSDFAFPYEEVKKGLIEFAKYHANKALDAASEAGKIRLVKYNDEGGINYLGDYGEEISTLNEGEYFQLDKVAILEAYPLENIK